VEAFLISMAAVAAAEFGDKTQFLVLLLGARFQCSVPILLGILASTILNYTLACSLGLWLGDHVDGRTLHWSVGVLFLAVAFWCLRPETPEENKTVKLFGRFGAFGTAFVTSFLTEMGDKTQIATVILSVKFNALIPVIAGATAGVILVNTPVILLGDTMGARLPVRAVRLAGAAIFGGLGLLALSGIRP
jgi:putative Ca2+/H+ antiporter (TMEM165/GDT1 family)